MLELPSLDLREFKKVHGYFRDGRPAEVLKTIINVLTTAIQIPADLSIQVRAEDDGASSNSDSARSHSDGSEVEGLEAGWVTVDFPMMTDARRALQMARELLAIVEDENPSSPSEEISKALHCMLLVCCALPWFDGTSRRQLLSREKARKVSESQAGRARQRSLLTEKQWDKVREFIEEAGKNGVTATEALPPSGRAQEEARYFKLESVLDLLLQRWARTTRATRRTANIRRSSAPCAGGTERLRHCGPSIRSTNC